MELEQHQQYTLFAQLNEDITNKDILLEQMKEITTREGYKFNPLTDMIYTITLDKIAPEVAIQSFKVLDGVTVALPHKTISLSTDNITQEYIERKLKMPISSMEVVNHNLTHINFDSVEKKQRALKAILEDKNLKQLLIYDCLTSLNNEVSTEHSNVSSRSSIEYSPANKSSINCKRMAHELAQDEIIQQQSINIENNAEIEPLYSSPNPQTQIEQNEEIASQQLKEEENSTLQSIQEPQIQKKRMLEQGVQYIELGFQYILLLTLISILSLRLFKGIAN